MLNIKVGGAAGHGVKSVGLMLAKMFMRSGYQVFGYSEYPSLIRGGHNTYQVYVSDKPALCQKRKLDIIIAINQETVKLHQAEFDQNTVIIFNQDKLKITKTEGKLLPLPISELIKKANGLPVMANNVAVGAICYLTGQKLKYANQLVKEIFGDKGEAIVKQNVACMKNGYDFAKAKFKNQTVKIQPPKKPPKQILVTGNDAIALGSIAGGMKFYSAYPMTPATSILHTLAGLADKYSLVVKQPEDEISAINMAIGASFVGVRSMTATSGGGFALMTEALGMAGMMELPLVVVEAARSGPSSGMPTWHSQGDLRQVLHASQGDFPKMVLAPGDSRQAFDLARQAFYFAEKYQLPVIILSDKYLSESEMSIIEPKVSWQNKRYGFVSNNFGQPLAKSDAKPFKRYQITASGISKRSVPGQRGGVYVSNSYEHDVYGYATEESEMATAMNDKRLRKFELLEKEVNKTIKPEIFGQAKADISLISWGSNKGPILEALKKLNARKKSKVNFMHLSCLWPFPQQAVVGFIKNSKRLIDLECNTTAQLAGLIRQQTGLEIKEKMLKYDGRPFYAEDIITSLN